MSSVTERVDEKNKAGSDRNCRRFRFRFVFCYTCVYRQIVREQRIPLNLSYPEPNKESLRSIEEAESVLANGGHSFTSAHEMINATSE